jgi:hypothetical protein
MARTRQNRRKLYLMRLVNSKALFGCALILWAQVAVPADIANPAIGIVVSDGDFQIDGFRARGNGTLLNGTTIGNLKSPSHVSLTGGARFDLAPDSHGQVFADRLILTKGLAQVWPAGGFWVLANGLRLRSDARVSHFRAARLDEMIVSVASVAGIVAAQTPEGTALAQIPQGQTRELATVTGCLGKVKSHYLLLDQATQALVEVKGPDVPGHVNRRVKITGVVDAVASLVVGVSRLIDEAVLTAEPHAGCKPSASGVLPVVIGMGLAGAAVVGGLAADQMIFTGGTAAGISPGH